MQEVFIIVAGEAELVVAGERTKLCRGDAVAVDAREVHVMSNRGSVDVEYVVVGVTGNKGGKTVIV
jgi:mannose-6-phosphate isomerase-like protein (cupin superfamily)